MKAIETIDKLKIELKPFRLQDQSIGFVPTMGYLHQGHLSLVAQSKKENDLTVVSIFVNPAQFGPHEDFDRYPRDLARDEALLAELGVDVIFYPPVREIYPDSYATYIDVEKLSRVLCGKSRPTHFRGVTTIVLKLFNIVSPTRAYFGRKDAQQAIIIKKMVQDLNLDITIRTIPIVRDSDGLALSSRNAYLSPQERQAALCLPQALKTAESKIRDGLREALAIKEILHKETRKHPLVKIDYLEVVSLDGLEEVTRIAPDNTLVAGAIRVGQTRLIDNFILGEI